jgi:hypothetical protein
MFYSNNREEKVKLECRSNSTNVSSKTEKMFAPFKCHFVQQKVLKFARCNSGLHFSGTESSHTPVLVAVGRQTKLEKAFPVVPP